MFLGPAHPATLPQAAETGELAADGVLDPPHAELVTEPPQRHQQGEDS
jgi:hypothetical protein